MKKERMRWGLERVNEMRGVVGKINNDEDNDDVDGGGVEGE